MIEINDIVSYNGPVLEGNVDLVHGAQYRVLSVRPNQYEIIQDGGDFPIRLAVPKNWVGLTKKNPRPVVERDMTPDRLFKCTACTQEIALKLKGEVYEGWCPYCNHFVFVPRGPA